jgi:oligoendopeptidase F
LHIRSGEVEELLAQSVMMARGSENVFTLLDDADLKYPVIKDEDGHEVRLTKQRFSKFMESSDPRVRRDAHVAFTSAYRDHVNTLSASLSASVNKDVFYARARKYESCLHHALDANNIPVSVYQALIDSTEANLAGLHKWMALRKRILGLKEMYPYDAFCPLFPEQSQDIPYDDAVGEVMEAIQPLGERYHTALKDGFANRWVDVFETEGKASGAYSWRNYTSHPFVLMNYNNTLNNLFTLAHEMGHAMHSHLSNAAQPFQKAQYAIFVAEVASTLNEGLLLRRLLSRATDTKQKLFLLNRQIDNTLGTFFHQVLYAHFELMIHDVVERGGALSPDRMNEMWDQLTRTYYGPAVTIDDDIKFKWSRIPHFYNSYYVYQYATSFAASQAIMDKFLAGEEGIVDKYLTLLSSGGNDYPINQLKKCGVDMTTPAPIEATRKLFAALVAEVERLTDGGQAKRPGMTLSIE